VAVQVLADLGGDLDGIRERTVESLTRDLGDA